MSHSDQLGYLEDCARLSVSKLIELGLPVTPNSYRIWYSYFADRTPDLRFELDALMERGTVPSADLMDKLHAKYFGDPGQGGSAGPPLSDLESLMGRLASFVTEIQPGAEARSGAAETDAPGTAGTGDSMDRDVQRLLWASFEATRTAVDECDDQRQAALGGLAELWSWKAFHDALRKRAIEVAETGGPVSLLMIDLDCLFEIDPRFGGNVRSRALDLIARIILERARPDGIAARYSATEFALVIVGADLDAAVSVARQISSRFAKDPLFDSLGAAHRPALALSIGVSEYATDESLAQFIQRARHALDCARGQDCSRIAAQRRHDGDSRSGLAIAAP